jgi:hypothetical protein
MIRLLKNRSSEPSVSIAVLINCTVSDAFTKKSISAGILSLLRGRRLGDEGLDVYRRLECFTRSSVSAEKGSSVSPSPSFFQEREGDEKNVIE